MEIRNKFVGIKKIVIGDRLQVIKKTVLLKLPEVIYFLYSIVFTHKL